jgi:hypothetical protein
MLQFPIASQPRYRHSSFETAITYHRTDETFGQLTLVHEGHLLGPAELVLAMYTMKGLQEGIAREEVTLSVAEARLLRDLLNRPEVAAVLDADDEEERQ